MFWLIHYTHFSRSNHNVIEITNKENFVMNSFVLIYCQVQSKHVTLIVATKPKLKLGNTFVIHSSKVRALQ